jgi:hypothetical protein
LRKAGLLGLALSPMAAVAVALVHVVASVHSQVGAQLAPIVLSAVLVLGLIGPLLTQLALQLSGETGAPRTAPGT